jgi:glycosyltransferase involved in cell wall biosynthesis
LIVGDGPERGRLPGELRVRGEALPGAAHFTGAVSHEAIPGLLASMDVAVAPYPALPDFYFSPLKVYEYLAAGRAVVASRIGQLARLIRHGTHGLLCPPGDAAALAASVAGLRHDSHLRRCLGQLGRRHVVQHHSWAAVARRILGLARREAPLAACRAEGEH